MGEEPAPAPADAPQAAPEQGAEIYKVKIDHFEGIHVLGDEAHIEGAPNFRQVKTKKIIFEIKDLLKIIESQSARNQTKSPEFSVGGARFDIGVYLYQEKPEPKQ